jgi:hypothetical protein
MPNLETKTHPTKQTIPLFRVPIWLIIQGPPCLDGSNLQGIQQSTALVEAENAESAIERLKQFPGYDRNYNNLQPEQRRRVQPFKLKEDESPLRLPDCERRHKNKDGDYTCGRPVHAIEDHEDKDDDGVNLNGEFGMCSISGYDSPEQGCPMPAFYQGLLSL